MKNKCGTLHLNFFVKRIIEQKLKRDNIQTGIY